MHKKLTFKSVYTGEKETYQSDSKDERVVNVRCPIDKTFLIRFETHSNPYYVCPNCDYLYSECGEEHLRTEREKIIAFAKKQASEDSKLVRILEAAGEKV